MGKDQTRKGPWIVGFLVTLAFLCPPIIHFLSNAPLHLRCGTDKKDGARGLPAVLHRNDIGKLLQKLNLRGGGAELGVKVDKICRVSLLLGSVRSKIEARISRACGAEKSRRVLTSRPLGFHLRC